MKILSCVFLLVCTCSAAFIAHAQVPEATQAFDRATRLLNQGAYAEAVSAYEEASRDGLESAALYYNRAIAHYRLEQIGESVLYFRRAELLDPDDPKVTHSLSIVSARIEDRFSELPAPIWTRLQRLLVSVIPVNVLLISGIVLYLALMALLVVYIKRIAENDWLRRARYVCGITAVFFLFAGFTTSFWPPFPDESVVLVDELVLYERPDEQASVSERIHEGLVVTTITKAGDWIFIQLPNGAQGWTTSDGLGAI